MVAVYKVRFLSPHFLWYAAALGEKDFRETLGITFWPVLLLPKGGTSHWEILEMGSNMFVLDNDARLCPRVLDAFQIILTYSLETIEITAKI